MGTRTNQVSIPPPIAKNILDKERGGTFGKTFNLEKSSNNKNMFQNKSCLCFLQCHLHPLFIK
jgi:hypothetical protein